MSKIVNLKEHIELEKQKKLDAERKRLVEAVRKVMLCSSCRMKCARCGVQVNTSSLCPYSSEIPFSLCSTCAEEYQAYQRSMVGQEDKRIPWHNQEWKEMWKAWIEYQKTLRKFQASPEVKDLFQ